jgi:hypothetical protein
MKVKKVGIKLLINSIKLLSVFDMDAETISSEVCKYFEEENRDE